MSGSLQGRLSQAYGTSNEQTYQKVLMSQNSIFTHNGVLEGEKDSSNLFFLSSI